MTIIFTIKKGRNVVMAGDRRATDRNLNIYPMKESKIFKGKDTLVGAAGDDLLCTIFTKAFRDRFDPASVDAERYDYQLLDFVHSFLPKNNKSGCHLLVYLTKRHMNFKIVIDGTSIIVERVTETSFIGCGEIIARSTFKALDRTHDIKTINDLKQTASLILELVEESNGGCGDGKDILTN